MALFTPAEQIAIVTSTDAQTKVFVDMATGSGGLQLNNPEVVAGINYLATGRSSLRKAASRKFLQGRRRPTELEARDVSVYLADHGACPGDHGRSE